MQLNSAVHGNVPVIFYHTAPYIVFLNNRDLRKQFKKPCGTNKIRTLLPSHTNPEDITEARKKAA